MFQVLPQNKKDGAADLDRRPGKRRFKKSGVTLVVLNKKKVRNQTSAALMNKYVFLTESVLPHLLD